MVDFDDTFYAYQRELCCEFSRLARPFGRWRRCRRHVSMVNPFDDRVAKYILGSQPYPRTEIPKTVQQNGVWDLTEASQRDTLYQWKMVTLECCCTTAKRMGSSNWGAVNLC